MTEEEEKHKGHFAQWFIFWSPQSLGFIKFRDSGG